VSRRARTAMLSSALAILPLLGAGCGLQSHDQPICREGDALLLVAQSVPSATLLPCIAGFPPGWSFGGESIRSGRSVFWLDSDRAGFHAVTVTLAPSCNVFGAVRVPIEPDEAGTARYEDPRAIPPSFSAYRYYVFPGGCVTYRFAFARGATFAQAVEATQALSFFSRADGVRRVRDLLGLELCGAHVRCPG